MTNQNQNPVCVCSDCDWSGPEEEAVSLYECADLLERIAPGEPVPAGECPECGALVHIDDADARMRDAAADLYEALASIAEHGREFDGIEDCETMVAKITEKARAALARAEGR